jgi:hypothetical protein
VRRRAEYAQARTVEGRAEELEASREMPIGYTRSRDRPRLHGRKIARHVQPCRTFECSKCEHVLKEMISPDPMKSDKAGWLAGEIKGTGIVGGGRAFEKSALGRKKITSA